MSGATRTIDPVIIESLEYQLKTSLRPVTPNIEFVNHLQTRLTSSPVMTIERRNTAVSLMAVALSLLSGVLLIWWIRSISNHPSKN